MVKVNCLNCGTEIDATDNYCHNCGQNNRSSRISVKELFNDFLGDYFTFDSKLFRSIYPLLFKPGFLTNEYIEGKRIKYIPPLRMYIFISIIYFFVISFNADVYMPKPNIGTKKTGGVRTSITLGDKNIPDSMFVESHRRKDPDILLDTLGWKKNKINQIFVTQFTNQYMKLKDNPSGFAPQILKVASIMMFFIMPIFALLLKLFYIRKGYFYIDHLIFSFHFHSFLFLILMLLYLSIDFIPGISITLITLIILFYLYKSLRNVYKQGRWKTFFKMSALLSSGLIILFFSFLVTMLVSFFLF